MFAIILVPHAVRSVVTVGNADAKLLLQCQVRFSTAHISSITEALVPIHDGHKPKEDETLLLMLASSEWWVLLFDVKSKEAALNLQEEVSGKLISPNKHFGMLGDDWANYRSFLIDPSKNHASARAYHMLSLSVCEDQPLSHLMKFALGEVYAIHNSP